MRGDIVFFYHAGFPRVCGGEPGLLGMQIRGLYVFPACAGVSLS